MYAAGNGYLDICKLLLEKGADVNLKDEVGCICHVIFKVSAYWNEWKIREKGCLVFKKVYILID